MIHTSAMLKLLPLVIAASFSLFCESASAQHGKRNWAKPGKLGVWAELERFDIERHGNQLWADYAFSETSWHAMRRLHLRPELRATVTNNDRGAPFRQTVQQDLRRRTGRVILPAPGGKYRAEVSIESRHGRASIFGIRSGALRVAAMVFESTRDAEEPPCGGRGQRKCISHQQAQQIYQQPVYQQVAHGAHEPQIAADPSDTIKACGEALYAASQQSTCVKTAASRPYGASVVRACGRALYSPSNKLKCIERAVQTRYNAEGLVVACGEAMYTPSDKLKCIDTAARSRRDPASTVRTCGESMHMPSAKLECIENAT